MASWAGPAVDGSSSVGLLASSDLALNFLSTHARVANGLLRSWLMNFRVSYFRHALPIFGLALAGPGCGENQPSLPMVENYSAAWQQALPPDINGIGLAPKELRWQAGTLYYRNGDIPMSIVALPVGPGVAPAPQVLSNEGAFRIWVEEDQVLYSQSETLKAVPTAGGGAPVTVLQGPDSLGISGSQRLEALDEDLDANYFYYDSWRHHAGHPALGRVAPPPRAGGDPQQAGRVHHLCGGSPSNDSTTGRPES